MLQEIKTETSEEKLQVYKNKWIKNTSHVGYNDSHEKTWTTTPTGRNTLDSSLKGCKVICLSEWDKSLLIPKSVMTCDDDIFK